MFHRHLLAQHMKDLGNPTFPRIIMKPKIGNWHLQTLGAEAMGLASRSLNGEWSKYSETNRIFPCCQGGQNIPHFHGKREQDHKEMNPKITA